jgi:L-threonylcarbamoyladenylate synthase
MAVAKIFEAKERPSFDPLIIHIADISDIERLTDVRDDRIYQLAGKFWPGSLTIILPKNKLVPDLVTSGLPTVGIRIPANEIALQLIRASGCPIAAPSANKFGRISPTTAQHVKKQLPDIDYIIDGGKTNVGVESTIIKLTERGFRILRNGIITREEIEILVPYDDQPENEMIDSVVAPGMVKSHYSPSKKMLIAGRFVPAGVNKSKAGFISFTGHYDKDYRKVIRVSLTNDLKEYAVNMYDAMHTLEDDDAIEIIIAEPVPEKGIGIAIMDRLKKAEYHWKQK